MRITQVKMSATLRLTILTAHSLTAVLRIEPGALCTVGKYPDAELQPPALFVLFILRQDLTTLSSLALN